MPISEPVWTEFFTLEITQDYIARFARRLSDDRGDRVMEKMTKYRKLLKQILEGHNHVSASFPSEGIERLLIMDEARGHYILMRLGWQDQNRIKLNG